MSLVGSSRITTRPGTTAAMQNATSLATPPDNGDRFDRHSSRSSEPISSSALVCTAERVPPRMRPARQMAWVGVTPSTGTLACGW